MCAFCFSDKASSNVNFKKSIYKKLWVKSSAPQCPVLVVSPTSKAWWEIRRYVGVLLLLSLSLIQTHRLPEWPFKAVCVRPLIVAPVHIGPVGPVPTCLPLCRRWPSSPCSAVWWAWPPTLAEFQRHLNTQSHFKHIDVFVHRHASAAAAIPHLPNLLLGNDAICGKAQLEMICPVG